MPLLKFLHNLPVVFWKKSKPPHQAGRATRPLAPPGSSLNTLPFVLVWPCQGRLLVCHIWACGRFPCLEHLPFAGLTPPLHEAAHLL